MSGDIYPLLFQRRHFQRPLAVESAKLHALRAHMPTCLACLHAHVPCVLTCSHANVPCMLTCSNANVPCVLTYSCANMSCVLMCQRALHAFCAYMPTCSRAITTNNKNKFSINVFLTFCDRSFFFLSNNTVIHCCIALTRRKLLMGAMADFVQ